MDSCKDSKGFHAAVTRIENAGASFYRALAAKYPEGRLRELFEFLASEEDLHALTFVQEKDDFAGGELDEAFADAGAILFFVRDEGEELGRMADAVKTGEQSLKLALLAEKDSVFFYSEIRSRTRNPGIVALLDRIIEDERRHFKAIYKLLKLFRKSTHFDHPDPSEMDALLREAVASDESRSE